MYLFFDTETTGLPVNWRAPISDSDNWPRLVQLAWAWYDQEGNQWDFYDYIIKPAGFIIPEESTKIHGISQALAEKKGKALNEVIDFFTKQVKQAELIVAHNIDFDQKIVGAELFRLKKEDIFLSAKKICTMKISADICRLPGNQGAYKWPNLNELHYHLFQEKLIGAHNALIDVFACARCFFALKKSGFKF